MQVRASADVLRDEDGPVHTGVHTRYELGDMGKIDRPTLRLYRFDHPQQNGTCWIAAKDDHAARAVVNERMRLLNLSPHMPVTFVVLPMKEVK